MTPYHNSHFPVIQPFHLPTTTLLSPPFPLLSTPSLSSPLPSLSSPLPSLVPRFGYLSEAPILGGDGLHQCPQPPQCILHYPHSRCRQERIYCGSECVCVCYCCSLASFSFCCWGGACSSPIWFFMWFCISGTRVGHRCLFLEMFPELVHVWETIVWIHCTSQILNSFSNLFPLPSLFCSSLSSSGHKCSFPHHYACHSNLHNGAVCH